MRAKSDGLRLGLLSLAVYVVLSMGCSIERDGPGPVARMIVGRGNPANILVTGTDGGTTAYLARIDGDDDEYGISLVDEKGAESNAPLAGLETDHSFKLVPMGEAKRAGTLALERVAKSTGLVQLDSVPVDARVGQLGAITALLRETLSRGANRIDIAKLTGSDYDPSTITGGYILRLRENANADDRTEFTSDLGMRVTVDYPGDPNDEEIAYVKTAYREFEYYLAYGTTLRADSAEFAQRYALSLLFSLKPGDREDCVLVKERSDGQWKFGPFRDVANSPLLSDSYDARETPTAGVYFDAIASKSSVKSLIRPSWVALRSVALSDASLSSAVVEAFASAGLSTSCEDSLTLQNRLILRARYLDVIIR